MPLSDFEHLWLPGDDARTLILFHGTGGDKAGFATLGADIAPGASRLSLDGPVLEGGMKRFFRRRAEGVYDMEDLAERTAQLAAFLPLAFAEYGIDPGQAVGIGYSNGANILANLILTGASPLPHTVLMHPLIPYETMPMPDLTGQSVRITAGERDPICPAPLTRKLGETLAGAGAAVSHFWHPGGHEVTGGELAAVRDYVSD